MFIKQSYLHEVCYIRFIIAIDVIDKFSNVGIGEVRKVIEFNLNWSKIISISLCRLSQ